MLSVAEAQQIVLQHARPLPPTATPLLPTALGRVLAEAVAGDRDSPPFAKSLMDGYAVRAADLPEGRGSLLVLEEVTAGKMPTRLVGPGQATRIMTGAPMPEGADAVVMMERTRLVGDRVEVQDRPPKPGQNVLPRAAEIRQGEIVLPAGTVLRPQEFGLLAAVGRTAVLTCPAPRVAVLSTGDELVEAGQEPGPGQIRNGNGPMLLAQIARAGGEPWSLGIVQDEVAALRRRISEALELAAVVVLSGGVSAGKLDLVPGVLSELGVTAHFHKVALKPGKPVFFGTWKAGGAPHGAAGESVLVFGLPGNPVSSLVCFELFVRPALRRLAGHADADPRLVRAVLTADFAYKTDRPTYHPAWLQLRDESVERTDGPTPGPAAPRAAVSASSFSVRAVPWLGSPDLRGLTRANAFLVLPVGDQRYQTGDVVTVLAPELA